jgi:Leucine-rich repeat (LRR) protein
MGRELPVLFFRFSLLMAILFRGLSAQGQLLDSISLAMAGEYTDLKAALEDGDRVVKLNLRHKKLKEFPMQILTLRKLQYLDLSRNRIKNLPDSIVNLSDLQYLIISKSGLESLPGNIGRMKNLKVLNVNQNEISMLPYSFGDLENLEVADLWSNNLEVFPESLSKLGHLREMDLRAILIPANQQERIRNLLPNVKIHFSPPCNCSW